MLQKSAVACLLASCLTATAAFAQAPADPAAGTTAPGAVMTAPGAAADQANTTALPTGTVAGQQGASLTPLAHPAPGQMLASDLRGTTVYGANGERIGDISDMLVERDGRTVAVIVGVGGFLGIGQKDVAVPFEALEVVADNSAARNPTPMGNTAAGSAAANPVGDPSVTGSVDSTQTGTVNPSRIVLRQMTKSDLENAPSFDRRGVATGSATAPANGMVAPTNQ